MNNIHRTNISDIDEDSLLILDFIVEIGIATAESLLKEEYMERMNVDYSLSISDYQIIEKLDYLTQLKLIEFSNQEKVYSLTEHGWKVWETEREPDWQRFCIDSQYIDEKGNLIYEVVANSHSIGSDLARVSLESKKIKYDPGTLQESQECNYSEVFEWKVFEKVFIFKYIQIEDDSFEEYNHELYENNRTWWRYLGELHKFKHIQTKWPN